MMMGHASSVSTFEGVCYCWTPRIVVLTLVVQRAAGTSVVEAGGREGLLFACNLVTRRSSPVADRRTPPS
eukprot:1427411-Rhodomonas_salina.1